MLASDRLDDLPHRPHSIQPHGVLLAFDTSDFSILQVSANTQTHLGLKPQQLLGSALTQLFSAAQFRTLLASCPDELNRVIPIPLVVKTPHGVVRCDGFIQRTATAVILELEPTGSKKKTLSLNVHGWVREPLYQLQQALDVATLLKSLVNVIQDLTGYGRVLVYRFDAQGAGEVIAEAKHREVPSYLGLHFPALDIPEWVRASYLQGKLRIIPNLQAPPVPLVASQPSQTAVALDLSTSVLRSSDPCAIEYYRNMGMSAALVISLIQDQALWGLISCHHPSPKRVNYRVRSACELLAQMAMSEVAKKERQNDLIQQQQHYTLQAELLAAIAQANNLQEVLNQPEERLLNLVNADGLAVCVGSQLTLMGRTPSIDQVQALVDWANRDIQDPLFKTHCLAKVYPAATDFKETASGLLRLQISKVQQCWMFWFRAEVLQTVNWAGQPDQGVGQDEQGQIHLSPRASFDLWQETVEATSLAWQPFEIKSALDFKAAIVGIVLKQAEELAQLNQELQRSNRELSAFSYAAAHDLKEPLRGIYNYANILQEDYGPALDEEGMEYLAEIQTFAQRMETLINALMRIAQLRQQALQMQVVDLNDVLANAVKVVRASWPEIDFELQVPHPPLPLVQGDPTLLNEVFRNLLNNAIKYNKQAQKWVEVGYQESPDDASDGKTWIVYVRDNGIGIRPEHVSAVFQLFKRLHPQEHYGGGAGVGLAIVNQIIERHNSHIWLESMFGVGSTFYFTLQEA